MYPLLAENNNISNIIIAATSAVAIVVTIIIYCLQISRANKLKANKYFDKLYRSTFALRETISHIVGFDWYYELSMSVVKNATANEEILLYLNTVNNMFGSVIKSIPFKTRLRKLIPIKLFNRLIALISYIEFYCSIDEIPNKFDYYLSFIAFCKKSKSIKKRYFKKQTYNWVGIRNSDTNYNKNIGTRIAIFRDDIDNTVTRPNQNTEIFTNYFIKSIENMPKKQQKRKLILYNQKWAYTFKEKIFLNCAGINDTALLDFINDKIMIRTYLQDCGILCIPSIVFDAYDLNLKKLKDNFDSDSWVIQEVNGSGGYGTWLVNNTNHEQIFTLLRKSVKRFSVSQFYENNVPINVTVIISEKQTAVFPASIQIIEVHDNRLMYRGTDFIAFRDLTSEIKEKILNMSSRIANCLRKKGYLGIAGIDLIVVGQEVYFCEVNPRFQASSPILSKYLADKESYLNSKKNTAKHTYESFDLFTLNLNAFRGIINTSVSFYDEINYSCYFYFKDNFSQQEINYKLKLLKPYVDVDGYKTGSKLDDNSYLFRIIMDKKICQISPDNSVWISDNIKINTPPQTVEELKIALLNQGVRIDETQCIDFKDAVFDAVDFLVLKHDLYINSPIDMPLEDFSPFMITKADGRFVLTFNGEIYSEIDLETKSIDCTDKPERQSLYLSTDRLRITPILGCDYKSIGKGCYFCNFTPCSKEFTLDELISAYEYSKELKYDHIMIGGGTAMNFKNEEDIISLIDYIHNDAPSKGITLMSIPLTKEQMLKYKKAGVTDVSYNMEILDEPLAKKLMPAKSVFTREYYYDALKQAKKIWPEYGNVRTLIIVGFDKFDVIIKGIHNLKEIGVQPVLSVFRPLKNSNLSNNLPPTNEYLLKVYYECKQILYPLALGPTCKSCRNNTLAL